MPGKELLVRGAVTSAVGALLAGALLLSGYDFDFRPISGYLGLFFEGLQKTITATVVAFAIGLILGVFVALARLSQHLVVRHLGDLYVEVIRGTPVIVQLTIAYFGLAPILGIQNKFAVGVMALGMFAAAYVGEIFRAGIESVDAGQFEAARSLGLSRAQTLRAVIFPQAVRRMIPPLTSELIALTKESSLLFYIGFAELMFSARQAGASTTRTFEAFLVVALFYLSVTIPLSLLSRRLEHRLGRSAPLGAHL